MQHPAHNEQAGATAPAGSAAEHAQRREYVRVPAACPVELRAADRSLTVGTYSVDVSGGGMLLAGPGTLAAGERVGFRLATGEDRPAITGAGTVVRVGPGGECAIEIDEIADGERRRLVRFVFECQRLARREQLEKEEGHGR